MARGQEVPSNPIHFCFSFRATGKKAGKSESLPSLRDRKKTALRHLLARMEEMLELEEGEEEDEE